MNFEIFNVGKDDLDRRLDKILRRFIPDTPLSSIYKYIRKGLIKVNQKKVKQEYHIQENDRIYIVDFILQEKEQIDTQDKIKINLPPVVFRNENILILNKPYDITVHGSEDSLDKVVFKEYKQTIKNDSLSFSPGPLHRLDRKTTGLIVFSQSLKGAKWFTENIKNHSIQKKYYAVLQGKLESKQEWNDFVQKQNFSSNNFYKVNVQTLENGNNSTTIAEPILYGKYKKIDFTLVEIEIKTGKTHQIRSQSALHGFPLLGDTAYGGTKIDKKYPDFFLQAFSLTFPKNPINLPKKIEIDYSNALKTFLNDCDVNKSGL